MRRAVRNYLTEEDAIEVRNYINTLQLDVSVFIWMFTKKFGKKYKVLID